MSIFLHYKTDCCIALYIKEALSSGKWRYMDVMVRPKYLIDDAYRHTSSLASTTTSGMKIRKKKKNKNKKNKNKNKKKTARTHRRR